MIPAQQPLTCLFTFLALACSSCSSENVGQPQKDAMETGDFYILSERDLIDAQKRKEEAGGKYAFSIYLHLAFGGADESIENKDKNYWLNLAADHGNHSAIQHRIFDNLDEKSKKSCKKALNEINRLIEKQPEIAEWVIPNTSEKWIAECKNILNL